MAHNPISHYFLTLIDKEIEKIKEAYVVLECEEY